MLFFHLVSVTKDFVIFHQLNVRPSARFSTSFSLYKLTIVFFVLSVCIRITRTMNNGPANEYIVYLLIDVVYFYMTQ